MARIALLAPDLGGNALYTPWMFAGALASRHETELIGPETSHVWPPAEGEVEISATLPGSNPLRRDVRDSGLAAVRGSGLLYAFKGHPASFGLGLRLKARLEVPLAVHLDDWDAAYFAGVPVLRRAWYAARTPRSADNEMYLRLLERRLRDADAITVSTRTLQRRFGGRLIPQGVDTDRFSPDRFPRDEARRRLGLEPDALVTIFLGTPVPHKGLAELVDAFNSLPASLRARLWIVGDPPDGAPIWTPSDRVEHRPSLPFGEAAWQIAASDVFVVPQRDTPYAAHQLPAKLPFAMALGACIVGTDVGDIGEVLDGEAPAGAMSPPDDPAGLREVLEALLEDPGRRATLSAESRRRAVERYSWHAMARALDEEIAKLGVAD